MGFRLKDTLQIASRIGGLFLLDIAGEPSSSLGIRLNAVAFQNEYELRAYAGAWLCLSVFISF